MKKTGLISFLFLALAFIMVSCNKDNIDNTTTDDGSLLPKVKVINDLMNRAVASPNAEGLDLGCFTIEYPFTLKDDQGGLHPVNDDTDFYTLFDSTSTGYVIVDYVYPINIADSTGTVTVINNLDELAEAFASCTPGGGWEQGDFPAYLINEETSCYNLVYPISLKNLNGDVVSISDETAFLAALANEVHFFVFPLTLDPVDGMAEVTVNDTDELFNALISCGGMPCDTIIGWENNFETIACYAIQFPLTVTLINGGNQTITNGQEFANVLIEGNVAGFVFPLQLIDDQNQVVTVNSEEELNDLVSECYTVVNPGINELQLLAIGTLDSIGAQPCYTVLFPVQAIPESAQGTVITVDNQNELMDLAFGANSANIYTLIYPVKVKKNEDNTEVIFNSLQEMLNLISDCR